MRQRLELNNFKYMIGLYFSSRKFLKFHLILNQAPMKNCYIHFDPPMHVHSGLAAYIYEGLHAVRQLTSGRAGPM